MTLSILNTPYQIGSLTVPNRYAFSPVTTILEYDAEKGGFTDGFIAYMTERAKGGFGLLIVGAMSVDVEVDYNPNSILLHKEAFLETGKRMTDAVHAEGSKIFQQISMGFGRNAEGQKTPSAVAPFGNPAGLTTAMTKEEIQAKIRQFIEGCKLAKEAGFDGIEVHAMHWGYLLDQFAMAITNKRTDEYGGDLDGRLRCAREIIEGIKRECGADYPVSMRFSLKQFISDLNQGTLDGSNEQGRTIEEAIEIGKKLESYGYDVLNVDTGIYDSFYYACPPMYMPQNFMKDIVAQFTPHVSVPVICGGRMNDPYACAEGVEAGLYTAVTLGRPAMADPYLPKKVFADKADTIRPCIACNQGCLNRIFMGQIAGCAVNAQCCRELENVITPAETAKKVAVVGGGAAGMEAARIAAQRGHAVTIYKASDHLGGHLIEAGAHEFKKEIRQLNDWYKRELAEAGVTVKLNTPVTVENVAEIECDAVIVATGSKPVMIKALDKAVVSLDAIHNPSSVGDKVIVIGGGLVGCEIAMEHAMNGKEVTVVEALPAILSSGIPAPLPNMMMIQQEFAKYGVKVMTNATVKEVTDTGCVVEVNGTEETLTADTVISAVGFRADNTVSELFAGKEVKVIGDAVQAKTILNAVWEGFEAGSKI